MDRRVKKVDSIKVSKFSRNGFRGTWVRPAILSKTETSEILERVPGSHRKTMREILVTHRNNPRGRFHGGYQPVHKALEEPLNGKRYRVASGLDDSGRVVHQLWEVRPQKR